MPIYCAQPSESNHACEHRLASEQRQAPSSSAVPAHATGNAQLTEQLFGNPFQIFDDPILQNIIAHLSPRDAVALSRSTPYVAPCAMREPYEAQRVNVLKAFRVPQALARLQKLLRTLSEQGLPAFVRDNPLRSEDLLSRSFIPEQSVMLEGHADVGSYQRPAPINAPANRLETAGFSSNGTLVSGGHDHGVRIWAPPPSTSSETPATWSSTELMGHHRTVQSVDLNRAGNCAISAGWDHEILLHLRQADGTWESQQIDRIDEDFSMRWYTPRVNFSPQGEFITTAQGIPSTVHLFPVNDFIAAHDNENTTPIAFAQGTQLAYQNVTFASDDRAIVLFPRRSIGSIHPTSSTVDLWEKGAEGTWQQNSLQGHTNSVKRANFSADGNRLLTVGCNESIVWDKDRDGHWSELARINSELHGERFSADGQTIMAQTEMFGPFSMWQINAFGTLAVDEIGGFDRLTFGHGFSPCGQMVYVSGETLTAQGHSDYAVKIFKKGADDNWVLTTTAQFDDIYGPRLEMSPDQQHVLLKGQMLSAPNERGSRSVGEPRVWLFRDGLESLCAEKTLLGNEQWVAKSASFNPDGSRISIIDDHNQLRVLSKMTL